METSQSNFIKLEEQIATLERELAHVKRTRNSYMTICRLPAETLVKILQYL